MDFFDIFQRLRGYRPFSVISIIIFVWVLSTLAACLPQSEADHLPLPEVDSLSFLPNVGQLDDQVLFHATTPSGHLFFSAKEILLALESPTDTSIGVLDREGPWITPVQVRFIGASSNPVIESVGLKSAVVNYLVGDDPETWGVGLTPSAGLTYRELYPSIDLHLTGETAPLPGWLQLKGTYTVNPGGDPAQIRWRYNGASATEINDAGDLVIEMNPSLGHKDDADSRPNVQMFAHSTVLKEKAPLAWQSIGGVKVPVQVEFRVFQDESIGFSVPEYDKGFPLIIDPTIEYSTYFGGVGVDEIFDVAVDSARSAVIVGSTISIDYPTDLPPNETIVGNRNIVVTKFGRNGGAVEFSTFVGGSGDEFGRSVAVDAAGDIFITGLTFSEDFPTSTVPILPEAEESGGNVFIIKLRPTGGAFRYSYLIGGTGDDEGNGIAVDNLGNAYVVGVTTSMDFPVVQPLQSVGGGEEEDGFLVILNAVGNEALFSTYLGGTATDVAQGVAVDRRGNSYVTGYTSSEDFPILNPLQESLVGSEDAFLMKFQPEGKGLVFSTYLGVGDGNQGKDVQVDRDGNSYVAGVIEGIANGVGFGGMDLFVAKVNSDGSALDYQTILGGSEDDEASSLGLDRNRNVFVVGSTESPDLSVEGSLQAGYAGNGDVILAQLDPNGELVSYNYIGGTGFDAGYGVAIAGGRDAVIAGITFSPDFPTIEAVQAAYGGEGDAFVLQIEDVEVVPTAVPTITPEPTEVIPTPTPIPSTLEALAQSDTFSVGVIVGLGLLFILLGVELSRRGRSKRK